VNRDGTFPLGWREATIGEVAEVNPPKPKLRDSLDQTPVLFVPMAALDDVSGQIIAAESRTLGEVRDKSFRTFTSGDVLFAKITPCMENGKAAVVPDIATGLGFGSTEFHVLRPGPSVDRRYLWHFVRQESYRKEAEHQMTGSVGQARVPKEFIEESVIPIPPLKVQLRIVASLDSAVKNGASAAGHLTAATRAIDRFRQAILAAACTGQLTEEWRETHPASESTDLVLERRRLYERKRMGVRYKAPVILDEQLLPDIPESWSWGTLPELGDLGRGKSKHRPRNDPKLYGGEYPFIQTGDVARSAGRIVGYSQTYNDEGLKQSRLWPARTVCITIAANIADSALLTFPACFPDSVVGLIVDEGIALPEYVELFIQTARRDLAAFAPATAQANINLAILSELAVALPPVKEQREIVRRVEAMYERCAKVEKAIRAATSRAERSSQAVLAKAFRGELWQDLDGFEPSHVEIEAPASQG
jgi:type I restriction enzyme S subunit